MHPAAHPGLLRRRPRLRRPVLAGSMVLEVASMLLCAFAPNIGWVIAARTLQGIATGAASGAFTASIIELAPARYKKLGTTLSTIAPAIGLGAGALFAGAAAQFTDHAPVTVFLVLALLTALGTVATVLCAETGALRPGAAGSLIPTVAVPRAARREFLAAVPVHMGGWLLAGLFMGLAPTVIGNLFHLHNGLVNGATVLAMQGPSALAGLAFGRLAPRRATLLGSAAIAIGAALIVVSVAAGVLPLLWIGGAVGGAGFGTSFSGAVRAIAPLAGTHERAGLFAAVYLVAYLTFGLPVIAAGFLVAPLGLLPTVTAYAVAIVASAVLGLLTQARIGRSGPVK
ncbi:MFS transporter [Kitasatospora sp. NPDC057512]|uniref:MFS transporter n=1 Tax=Kitasatospora sp. NPDC057512 TaxID=3346154 RepID=UPI003673AECB